MYKKRRLNKNTWRVQRRKPSPKLYFEIYSATKIY